jgi:hypothetical protein
MRGNASFSEIVDPETQERQRGVCIYSKYVEALKIDRGRDTGLQQY